MFIFDRCCRSSAAVTPVKYECDANNLRYFCKIENFAYGEINEGALVTPSLVMNGLLPDSAKPLPELILGSH